MKKISIYKQIKQEIISGRWRDGDKLPTEWEYVSTLHVSRDTIRGAFKMLEESGFITRIKAKGTFIRLPEVPENSRIISLLVPCSDYLRYTGGRFQQLLFDLIAEAAMQGWRIVPVIFSKSNSPDDIWWENLSHFNSDSRIVLSRCWFSSYFATLSALQARVAFINNDAEVSPVLHSCTSGWMNFIEEDMTAAGKAVTYLRECNCRKIALIMPLVSDPANMIVRGYRAALHAAGLQECICDLLPEATRETVRDFYRREHFDGMIIHFHEDRLPAGKAFRECFSLPPDLPVVAIPRRFSSSYLDPHEKVVTVEYAMRSMAHDIVHALISDHYRPEIRRYAPSLFSYGRKIL